jgi:hypothetical protein
MLNIGVPEHPAVADTNIVVTKQIHNGRALGARSNDSRLDFMDDCLSDDLLVGRQFGIQG